MNDVGTQSDVSELDCTLEERVARLYRQCGRRMRRIANEVLHDEHESEDATQDAFLLALIHAKRLRDIRALEGWLHRTVRNVAVNRARRRFRCRPADRAVDDTLDDSRCGGARVLRRSGSVELDPASSAMLSAEYARLRPEAREAVYLHYVKGLSCLDVAQAQQVAEGCVRTRIYRVRQTLLAGLTER